MVQLAEALRYNPEGRGSIPNVIVEINHLINTSDPTMALGLPHTIKHLNITTMYWRNKAVGA